MVSNHASHQPQADRMPDRTGSVVGIGLFQNAPVVVDGVHADKELIGDTFACHPFRELSENLDLTFTQI
jgi:hypothetical protein